MPYGLMAQALVALDLVAFLGLAGVTVTGWGIGRGWMAPERHMLLAIPAALFQLFGHSLTMFYFIGIGRRLKEWAAERGGDVSVLRRSAEFKQRIFPWATLALGLVIVVFVLGGGVNAGLVPAGAHGLLAIAALVVGAFALFREVVGIGETLILIHSLPGQAPAGAPREDGGSPRPS